MSYISKLVKFGLEHSQEPVIKNPILRAALEEPRTMAEGGRIGLKPGGIVEPGVMHYGRKSPTKINEDLFKQIDELVAEAGRAGNVLGKKGLGEGLGYKVVEPGKASGQGGINKIINAWEESRDTVFEFKPAKFTKDSPKVKQVIELFENGMSKNAIAYKTGISRKEIRNIFHQFAKQYIGDKNLLTGEGKNAVKKRRKLIEKEMKAYWKNKPGGKEMLEEMNKKLKSIKDKNLEIIKKVDGKYVMTDQEILNNKMFKKAMGLDVKRLKAGEGINFNRYANLTDADYVAKIRAMAETNQFYQPEHSIPINKKNPASMLPKNIYTATGKMGGQLETLKSYVINNPKGDYVSQIDELFTSQGLPTSEHIISTNLEKKLINLGNGSKEKALVKLKSGKFNSAEKKIVDDVAEGLKQMGGKSGLPKKFWTTALKGEGYVAIIDFFNNLTKGQSLDKSFSNAVEMVTFGGIDLGGNERDLMKYAKERDLDREAMKEWMDYAQTYGKYAKTYEDLDWATKQTQEVEVSPDDEMMHISTIERAPARIEKLEGQLEEKGKAETIQSGKGYKDMNEAIEGVVAKEWNEFAGTPLDIGFRKMLGMKGDEGVLWGGIGALTRETLEKMGFGEHKALKKFKPQTVMNYHPAYGYKEDIKDVIRGGDSPMEDMLYFMDKYYPNSGLLQEALRTKKENLKKKKKWVDTGWGRKNREVNKDMGTYDYNPNMAGGGIAGIRRPNAIPPESGPTPYGLPSMYNRVRRI